MESSLRINWNQFFSLQFFFFPLKSKICTQRPQLYFNHINCVDQTKAFLMVFGQQIDAKKSTPANSKPSTFGRNMRKNPCQNINSTVTAITIKRIFVSEKMGAKRYNIL